MSLLLRVDIAWQREAECRDADPAVFFPPHGGKHPYRKAREICARCLVREACLDAAMDAERGVAWRDGMFGGLTPDERHSLWRTGRRR